MSQREVHDVGPWAVDAGGGMTGGDQTAGLDNRAEERPKRRDGVASSGRLDRGSITLLKLDFWGRGAIAVSSSGQGAERGGGMEGGGA